MSDIAKWGLLVAGAVALIALIIAMPFMDFINFGELGNNISTLLFFVGDAFTFGRRLINVFLTPFGRSIVTGLMIYWLAKPFIGMGIKMTAWIYHFVFK